MTAGPKAVTAGFAMMNATWTVQNVARPGFAENHVKRVQDTANRILNTHHKEEENIP